MKAVRILMLKDVGFCFGVRRAVSLCEEALKRYGKAVSPGPIIHNERVMQKLLDAGLRVDENLASGREPVVIPSHGLHPKNREALEKDRRIIIDATCPRVRHLQELVSGLRDGGYRVLIIGKPDHPEVKALLGFAGDAGLVYPTSGKSGGFWEAGGVEDTLRGQKMALVSQTTVTEHDFYRLLGKIVSRRLCSEYRIFDTVCRVTEKRQQAALQLAGKVDVMLVAGSNRSANTTNLYRLLRQQKSETYLISEAEEINKEWLAGRRLVGLVSGTSTPMEVITEIKIKSERM